MFVISNRAEKQNRLKKRKMKNKKKTRARQKMGEHLSKSTAIKDMKKWEGKK